MQNRAQGELPVNYLYFNPDLQSTKYVHIYYFRRWNNDFYLCPRLELHLMQISPLLSPCLSVNLSWHQSELSDHPDEGHSTTGGWVTPLQSEACLSAVALTVGNLILSRLEKGSSTYKKICQAELRHFTSNSLAFLSFVALQGTHSRHTGWVTSIACQPLWPPSFYSIPKFTPSPSFLIPLCYSSDLLSDGSDLCCHLCCVPWNIQQKSFSRMDHFW